MIAGMFKDPENVVDGDNVIPWQRLIPAGELRDLPVV
jgi:hypothetical protein